MSKTNSSSAAKWHPIQIRDLGVRELYIRSNRPPSVEQGAEPTDCSIRVVTTPYDKEEKQIAVSLKLESGVKEDEKKAPYVMKIEVIGIFDVDDSRFPLEHIYDWAQKNAPMIIYPYLREHAFGLSSRCGFKPLLLPLLEVPVFKIESSKTKKTETKPKTQTRTKVSVKAKRK